MGAQTDAARAQVLARRSELLDESQRLEASARAAVDIPAKIRRQPAKTAGLIAGTAFLVAGGPQRLFRRARRVVRGPEADLPKAMLPKDIEKSLKKLGSDGDKVRPILEREFASYLQQRSKVIREADRSATIVTVLGNVLRPLSYRLGLRLAEQLFDPERENFEDALARIRARVTEMSGQGTGPGPGSTAAAGEPLAPKSPATSSGAASRPPTGSGPTSRP